MSTEENLYGTLVQSELILDICYLLAVFLVMPRQALLDAPRYVTSRHRKRYLETKLPSSNMGGVLIGFVVNFN